MVRLDKCALVSAVALIAAGIAVSLLYLGPAVGRGEHVVLPPATTAVLVVALVGPALLIALYIMAQQREKGRLRAAILLDKRHEESLRSRLTGLTTLLSGILSVRSTAQLEMMLQSLAEHLSRSLNASRCVIHLVVDDGRLRCAAAYGVDAEAWRSRPIVPGSGVPGWVAQYNEPLVLTRDMAVGAFASELRDDPDCFAALGVPMVVEGRLLGTVCLYRSGGGPAFTPEDTCTLLLFGGHVAVAIENIRHYAEVRRVLAAREQELKHAEKMELLGRLAAGVAHDFNNLLTVILTYSRQLSEALEGQHDLRGKADEVLKAGERTAALTRQLLAFSRRQVMRLELVDLNTLVRGMSEMLRRLIGENIRLNIELAPSLGVVQADPGQIDQVILNLVVNAREAMPGGGRLVIQTAVTDRGLAYPAGETSPRPLRYATLRVCDSGYGIDAATRERIFDPYFTTKERGNGLGLATVYGIVKQSGGDITVQSELGRGTTFEVHLPIAESTTALEPEEIPEVDSFGGLETILLVDDEPTIRRLVRDSLEDHGYTVLEAESAERAMETAQEHDDLDLILTDVVLPGQSGAAFAEGMAVVRPDVPVVCMSGYVREADLSIGNSRRAIFLQKPFDEETMLRTVRCALDRAAPARDQSAA